MANLYVLPLYEETFKPYTSHQNDYKKYKNTPFESIVLPVFGEGARRHIEKYSKTEDYEDNGSWYRPLYHAKKYAYNVIAITIDGKRTFLKHMVTAIEVAPGNHEIKLEMRAYQNNPLEKEKKGVKGLQMAQDYAVVDASFDNDNYFLIAKHKVQQGAYVYNSGLNDGTTRINNTFFEYHSATAELVSIDNFMRYIEDNVELTNLTLPRFNAPIDTRINTKSKDKNISNEPTDIPVSVPNSAKEVYQTKKVQEATTANTKRCTPQSIETKKLNNDEYFDLLVDNINTSKTPIATTPKAQQNKREEKINPIKYVTDRRVGYSELYEDGKLFSDRDAVVRVPRQITHVDENFLWRNQHVKEVEFPEGITTLENREIAECPNLEKVILPKNLINFNTKCISGCPKLKYIILDETNPYYTVIDNVLYKKLSDGSLELILYPAEKEDAIFTTPNNCTRVSYSATANAHIKKLYLPSVQFIDLSAFCICRSLEEVSFSKDIKEIGTFAFECTSLEKVEIPFSCKIKSNAFPKNCKVKKKLFFK